MAKFSSEHQPDKRRGRGPSERTKILDAMKREAQTEDSFYDMLIRRAFNPEDNFAFKEALQRLAPLKKATMPMVEFEFDDTAKPHEQAAQVLKAAADGLIPPDIANIFVGSIASMIKIEEVTEIAKRLESIEASLGIGNG
jgi:hypothetical protein